MLALHSTLRNRARAGVPARAVFENIAEEILGKTYDLSLVFIGDKRSCALNKKFRHKDKPTNVLAFPLSKTSGELFINIPLAWHEARRFNHTTREHIVYLFIHGCLHLKGLDHGPAMERREQALMKKFSKRIKNI